MDRIIFVDAKALKTDRKSRKQKLLCALKLLLGQCFPVQKKEADFLGYSVEAYLILGTERRTAAAIFKELEQNEDLQGLSFWERRRIFCFFKTLRKMDEEIAGKRAFLFCTWEQRPYPAELVLAFYKELYRMRQAVREAQQLILFDGEGAYSFAQSVYSAFNYMTVITDCPKDWEAFAETAYEESGLSVRCITELKGIKLSNKKTLAVDFCKSAKKGLTGLPADCIYLDFCEDEDKRRRIGVKCPKTSYISLYNALDTALKDTV